MREIKFEAIYTPTGEHFVPHEIDFKNGTLTGDWDNEVMQWCNFSLDGKTGDAILRQYTGLKDKNGKEIYEGDVGYTRIVRYKGSERIFLSVVRCDRCFWDFYDKERDIPHEIWPDDQFEIIGNIYEHPHLLEGRDEV